MAFWRKLDPETPFAQSRLPPLTDETLYAFERKFGIRLPVALVELLRIENGGLLENSDFKFQGKDCGVSEIFGVSEAEHFHAIKTCASILDGWDDQEFTDKFRSEAGDPARVFLFGDNDYEQYALDYNRLNASGEPTILWVMMGEGNVSSHRVAESFSEFLLGQCQGDPEPTASMEDAEKYELIAEGGYSGHHREGGSPVEIAWKICADGDRFVVFAREYWSHDPPARFSRAEFKKSALLFQRRVAKWEIQEAGGSEFMALLRRAVERFDALIKPDCYVLRLGVSPGAGDSVIIKESVPYDERWKNTSDEVVYTEVYSSDRAALEEAMRAVVESA